MNKSILSILFITLIVLIFTVNESYGQTCKIGSLFNQAPKECKDCTTCTGANPTCATKAEDATIFSSLILLTGDCRARAIEQSCSRLDPKNQQYVNGDQSYRICKAWCEKRKSTCNDPTDCSSYPTTDCWNSATTSILSLTSLIVIIASILLF